MQTDRPLKSLFRFWLLVAWLSVSLAVPVRGAVQPPTGFSFNFNNADLRTVIRTVARLTGKNFILDPRVTGKVTIISTQPLAGDDIYQTLLAVLAVHGYLAVESPEAVKILPQDKARQEGGPVLSGTPRGTDGDHLVTWVRRLHYVAAMKLLPILKPLLPPKSHISAHPDSNILVITDRLANLKRLDQVIARIDQAGGGPVEVVRLEHADAREVMTVIEALERRNNKVAADQLRMAADDRTNSLLLAGDRELLLRIKALIVHLDSPLRSQGGNTKVVFLRYAKAKDMAKILTDLNLATGGKKPSRASAGKGKGAVRTAFSSPASGTHIQADENTNALIITAPPSTMRALLQVVRQLDIRRAQVMIEAIIAEVSADKAAELGIQWRSTSDINSDNNAVIGGTNFNNVGTGTTGINQLSSSPLSVGDGFSLGYFEGTTSILGTEVVNLGVLIRALAADTDSNILSTPSLVTLDNEEAEIVVGQNVPFITGSYTSTGTGSSTPENPFQTIERRDIGVKLKVTPQINEGNTIRLDIEQEVSNLTNQSTEGGTITNNRSIKTSVLVENGKLLVLGGLMSEDVQKGVEKVPLLGDLPLLGLLFRYSKNRKIKQNLMVFLRPVILRDDTASARLSLDKYDLMRQRQQEFNAGGLELLPGETPPQLEPPAEKRPPAQQR